MSQVWCQITYTSKHTPARTYKYTQRKHTDNEDANCVQRCARHMCTIPNEHKMTQRHTDLISAYPAAESTFTSFCSISVQCESLSVVVHVTSSLLLTDVVCVHCRTRAIISRLTQRGIGASFAASLLAFSADDRQSRLPSTLASDFSSLLLSRGTRMRGRQFK